MINPINGYILLKAPCKNEEEKTNSGIIITRHHNTPDTRLKTSKVLKVSKYNLNEKGNKIKTELKENDIVIYDKLAGQIIKENDQDIILIREADIYAIIAN